MSLPPPPIQAWRDMPTVWQRWFIELYRRAGGTSAVGITDLELQLAMTRETPILAETDADQDYTASQIITQQESLDALFSSRESGSRNEAYEVRTQMEASGWNDVLSDLTQGFIAGGNTPTWANLRNGINALSFSAVAMNEVWINLHVLHDYQWGTKVFPHIHWTTAGTNAGTCRWGIEYTFARGYNTESFPATTTIYLEQAASGTAYRHMIAEPSEANGILLPGCEPDGVLMCRIFRDAAHPNDTLTDAAFGIFCDLHYQSDGLLTHERNRTFTKRRV